MSSQDWWKGRGSTADFQNLTHHSNVLLLRLCKQAALYPRTLNLQWRASKRLFLRVTSMMLMRAFQIMLNFKEASSILLFSLLLSKILDFESSNLYSLLVGLDLLIPSGAWKHKTIPYKKKQVWTSGFLWQTDGIIQGGLKFILSHNYSLRGSRAVCSHPPVLLLHPDTHHNIWRWLSWGGNKSC